MTDNDSSSFENAPDDLYKEPGVGFFDTESQKRSLGTVLPDDHLQLGRGSTRMKADWNRKT